MTFSIYRKAQQPCRVVRKFEGEEPAAKRVAIEQAGRKKRVPDRGNATGRVCAIIGSVFTGWWYWSPARPRQIHRKRLETYHNALNSSERHKTLRFDRVLRIPASGDERPCFGGETCAVYSSLLETRHGFSFA